MTGGKKHHAGTMSFGQDQREWLQCNVTNKALEALIGLLSLKDFDITSKINTN